MGHPDKICRPDLRRRPRRLLAEDPHAGRLSRRWSPRAWRTSPARSPPSAYVDFQDAWPAETIVGDRLRQLGQGLRRRLLRRHGLDGQQSPDIAQGVDTARRAPGRRQGQAGGRRPGLMFGYACDDTAELMPLPIYSRTASPSGSTEVRKNGRAFLAAAGRQEPGDDRVRRRPPVRVDTVVVSTQHAPEVEPRELAPSDVEQTSSSRSGPAGSTSTTGPPHHINPTGRSS
jgi:S-adenosylmethionine synthetase